jgi:hypothetical protein
MGRDATHAEHVRLTRDALIVQLLRPLRRKGKCGRNHTTPFENVWVHGVPPHQRGEAHKLAEELIRHGLLAEKPSGGRRHVWLTREGLAELERAEAALPEPLHAA